MSSEHGSTQIHMHLCLLLMLKTQVNEMCLLQSDHARIQAQRGQEPLLYRDVFLA